MKWVQSWIKVSDKFSAILSSEIKKNTRIRNQKSRKLYIFISLIYEEEMRIFWIPDSSFSPAYWRRLQLDIWRLCDCASLVRRRKQPNKMQKLFAFINLFKSAHVSGDKFAHPQEHFFDCVYSFWYNAPTLLPTGALYQKLYIQSKSAPEDGRICRPKHVGLI